MQYAFLPIILFVLCVIVLAVGLLVVARLLNPGHCTRAARVPYESGMDPVHDTRRRFDIRFHLLAIAFLVFDVELLFLFPWAVASQSTLKQSPSARCSAELAPSAGEKSNVAAVELASCVRNSAAPGANRRVIFAGVMVFIALLALGYAYDWRKGVFRWR